MAVITIPGSQEKSRRDWVGGLCLRYVTWRERRKETVWVSMTLTLEGIPDAPRTADLDIQPLGSLDRLPILTQTHNRAYRGAGDYQKVGWIQRRAVAVSTGFNPELNWLVFKGGKSIAYCMARCKGDAGRVTGLAVLPEYRRRKIGTTLVQHAIAVLARRGARTIQLFVPSADHHSQALYRKLGFRFDA